MKRRSLLSYLTLVDYEAELLLELRRTPTVDGATPEVSNTMKSFSGIFQPIF